MSDPLLNEGLSMTLPRVSIFSFSHPRYAYTLHDFIFPSGFRSAALFILFSNGIYSVTIFVHLLSLARATCPAHCHFNCFILAIISCVPVCCLTHTLVFLSRLVIPIIALSMLLCVVRSLSCILLVTAHVWHPYVNAACTHRLYTFLLRHIGICCL